MNEFLIKELISAGQAEEKGLIIDKEYYINILEQLN
jgi:hypothetical protein